jgi:polygalacturonase
MSRLTTSTSILSKVMGLRLRTLVSISQPRLKHFIGADNLVDGWDIYRSSNVAVTNSYIINGDDCVSFKPNSTNILVENLYCSGSHGISVGSLGEYAGTQDIVQNVLVKNITMVNAENGARIKAFGGSSSATSTSGGGNGYAQNITFQDFHCEACGLPIVIDQCYETSSSTCASYPSKVIISDIHYINVTGTSTSKEVVSLVCSDICQDITATGTNLVGTSGTSEYYCTNIASTADLDFPCSASGSIVSASKSSTTKTTSTKTTSTTKKTTTTSSSTKTTKTTTTSSTKTTPTTEKTTTTTSTTSKTTKSA